MRAVDAPDPVRVTGSRLLPVLPLEDLCLFPGASLALVLDRPATVSAALLAARCGGHLLALARRENGASPRDLHTVGTDRRRPRDPVPVAARAPRRARRRSPVRASTCSSAPRSWSRRRFPIEEGDEADEWGPAVEALARYLHAHADLRAFLEKQRRSTEGMSWVNLACQHLPITSSARQKLLESNAPERCLRISRGLDALLRKEQTA